MNLENRIKLEKKIVRHLFKTILSQGYYISIYDGEAYAVKSSRSFTELNKGFYSTDEDVLYIRTKDENDKFVDLGFVHLVYGNDGYDVISNYSCRLEEIIRPTLDYTDKLESKAL